MRELMSVKIYLEDSDEDINATFVYVENECVGTVRKLHGQLFAAEDLEATCIGLYYPTLESAAMACVVRN